MTELLSEQQGALQFITLNRVHKHNAFDDGFLKKLQSMLDAAEANTTIRVIILKANGKHFSAGADLAWMQRMAHFNDAENIADAQILAKLMYTLHHCSKPTIAMVHGKAIGGGVGLVAACDIAIAADTASFCFSEVRLGLIPAVISPYVIKAIGERAALSLFMSAEPFDAKRAEALQLIQHCVPEDDLLPYTLNYAAHMAQWPPKTLIAAKALVREVAPLPIDETMQYLTATLIAKQRASIEAQQGLAAFLKQGQSPS